MTDSDSTTKEIIVDMARANPEWAAAEILRWKEASTQLVEQLNNAMEALKKARDFISCAENFKASHDEAYHALIANLQPLTSVVSFLLDEIWRGKTVFDKSDVERLLIDHGYDPGLVVTSMKSLIEIVLPPGESHEN
jgi:hypothetical protein